MRNKPLVLIPLALLVIMTSGCINTAVSGNRPEDVAKTITEVQDYLATYPDSDMHVTYNSEGYIKSAIAELTDRCGPYFKITEYWKIVLDDPFSTSSITVWIEKDTNQLACLYGEGVDSPPPIMPDVEEEKLLITGFSRIEISEGLTSYNDNILTITIRNPSPERITVKRVTASYLDDIITNITDSGMLSHGDYFTYEFDLSRTIENGAFWIDVDVLYDDHDTAQVNQRSRGSIISGIDVNRILQCSKASFDVKRYNFYIGTRIFDVSLENTGDIDLTLKTYLRDENGELSEPVDPLQLTTGDTESFDIMGLTRIKESVLFVSEACPGASEVIFIKDIPGV